MTLRPGLRLGTRPAPLQVPARPRPEVKVEVRRERRGGLLLGDVQLGGGGGGVDEALGQQVRGDAGPGAAPLGVGPEGLEGRARQAGGLEDADVVVHVGPRRGRAARWRLVVAVVVILGVGGWRGRVPGVQAVGAAEADDVLDLGEGDGCYGVIGPCVVGGELEPVLDCAREVVLCEEAEGIGPGFCVFGPGGGVEG